jgi:hypothetical protein
MCCVDPILMVKALATLSPFRAFTLRHARRSSMQVGDLVCMPGSIDEITGIVIQTEPKEFKGRTSQVRVKIFWIQDAEASWEPVKWLEVISA